MQDSFAPAAYPTQNVQHGIAVFPRKWQVFDERSWGMLASRRLNISFLLWRAYSGTHHCIDGLQERGGGGGCVLVVPPKYNVVQMSPVPCSQTFCSMFPWIPMMSPRYSWLLAFCPAATRELILFCPKWKGVILVNTYTYTLQIIPKCRDTYSQGNTRWSF